MLNQKKGFELNSEGYLVDFDAWNKDFAIDMAKENSLELNDIHWLIIELLRDYYPEYGISPDPREIIKILNKRLKPDRPYNKKQLESIFKMGGCNLACKLAGLPGCYCRGL